MRKTIITTAAVVLVAAGCDLGVTNPAQIEAGDLQTPAAVPAIVNGARGSFGLWTTINGGGGVYTASAMLADELTHAGSWVPLREISDGVPGNASPENQSHWNMSQARWQAEDAAEKAANLVANPGTDQWVALANLYAGFSNRVMGELFCDAVINGGGLEPHTAFSARAVEYFTEAIQVAQAGGHADLLSAAYAGRAQARMMLNQWDQAVADAGQVATSFVYSHIHSENSGNEHNGVHNWAYRGDNGFQTTVWGTPFADWGLDTAGNVDSDGDPRATFTSEVRSSTGALIVGGDTRRPFWRADKYTARSSGIPLAKGTEMRLIEAEALLRGGNAPGALLKINEVRAHRSLTPAVGVTADDVWALLVRERGLELWLEGRRLGDLRRWADHAPARPHASYAVPRGLTAGQPASADPRANVLDASPLCLRVSTNEIFSNPNLNGSNPR
ncbi:MAG TPA: RagB/SusD family nutrient uptake outer membrane protein [Longimicrobiales bacterium]|nr:RagB/SusD family nutrient uptake outer membrane protein [Longimicrobiales bacterium]